MKKWLLAVLVMAAVAAGYVLLRPVGEQEPLPAASPSAESSSDRAVPAGASVGGAKPESAAESVRYDSQRFQSFTADVLHTLPTRADLQRLSSEEAHHTPKIVMDAGVKLGEIAEILARQPELEGDAFFFYESCATGGDYPQSVRALCFFHWERLGKKLQRGVDADKVPENVRRIARQL